jgi:hypothetical protein
MPSRKGFMDQTPYEWPCQYEGCNKKVKTTVGALRRSPTLRCSAGHKNVIDAGDVDKGVRQVEQRVDKMFR